MNANEYLSAAGEGLVRYWELKVYEYDVESEEGFILRGALSDPGFLIVSSTS